MLTSATDKNMHISIKLGNLDYAYVLSEAGIHRTKAVSNQRAIL